MTSLRAEFVIAGSAFLLTFLWGWEALRLVCKWREAPWLAYLAKRDTSAGAWVFAAAVAVGLAYVVGAFVVQLTFERPTRHLIREVQRSRVQELRLIDALLRNRGGTPAVTAASPLVDLLFQSGSEAIRQLTKEPADLKPSELPDEEEKRVKELVTGSVMSFAQTLGRSSMSSDLTDQYDYRRSNRQVFVGIIPSLFIAAIDVAPSFDASAAAHVALCHRRYCACSPTLLRSLALPNHVASCG